MSGLKPYIQNINDKGGKALSIFLTAGFPSKNNFHDLALKIFDAGADMIELGIPFSDPLADGPTIQYSSEKALKQGVGLRDVFAMTESISSKTDKPVILMGYANPILNFGIDKFFIDAANAGAKGVIIPDVPVEESSDFFNGVNSQIEKILLATPYSSEERIKKIDAKSEGFVYCVSVSGTTGARDNFSDEAKNALKKTYTLINKNKTLIGFGISSKKSIESIYDYGDGFIVGSAVIKAIDKFYEGDKNFNAAIELVKDLKSSC